MHLMVLLPYLYMSYISWPRKPTAQQMVKRLLDVCAAEDLQVNGTTLETLYAAANGDIRLIMGQLQMIRLRHRTLSYDDAKVVVCP